MFLGFYVIPKSAATFFPSSGWRTYLQKRYLATKIYKVYLPGLHMENWKLTKLSLTLWPRPAILLKFQPRSSYISPRHRISSQMPSLMLHGQSQQRPLKTYPMKNMCRCCSNFIQLIDSTFIVTHIEFRPHLFHFFTDLRDLRHFKNGRVSNGW